MIVLAIQYFAGLLAIVLLFFLLRPTLPKGKAEPESLPPAYVAKVRRTATWTMISVLILTTIVIMITLRGHSTPPEHAGNPGRETSIQAK